MTDSSEMETLVEHLTTRSGMYVIGDRFFGVCNYLNGFNHARDGAPLAGFQEWLVMRLGKGNNLHWSALIAMSCHGDELDESGPPLSVLTADQREQCVDELRVLLCEFLSLRARIGLRNILYDHGVWLRRQRWFNEDVERYGSSTGP